MAKSDLTAINAKTISVNGSPIAGSATAYGPYTTFDQLDADVVLALNGTVIQGVKPPGQAFTAIDHLNVLSGLSVAEAIKYGTFSTPASNNATGPIGIGGGTIPLPTPTPTPLPSYLTQPTITTDGTPQVGETAAGVDGTVANLGSNALTRAWLFNGVVQAATPAFTFTQVGTYTYRNRITVGGVNIDASATVTVAAAPSPTISFANPTATVAEGNSGTQTVANTININRDGLVGAVTINLAYSGTADGSDYTSPASITIAAGANSVSFNTTINGDTSVEPDETIVITATLAGYSGVTATKTITVTNDDQTPVNAPTLTKTSTAGTNPIAFTMASDTTVQVGMYVRLEMSQDGVTKGDGGYQTVFRTEERQLRSDDMQSGGELSFSILSNLPDGAIYAHVQVSRDDGVKSAWSNSVTDVLSSAPVTTLDPATKSQYLTLSNGNLTMVGNNDAGPYLSCKSSTSRGGTTGDFYFEAVAGNGAVQQGASYRNFGVCPASVPTDGTNFKEIGGNTAGIGWFSGGDRYDLRANNAGQYYEYPPSWQTAGTVIGLLLRVAANGTRKVYLHKNGAWLSQLGDPYASTPGAGAPIDGTDTLFAFGSCTRDDTLTFRFKASQQTYKPANATSWGG